MYIQFRRRRYYAVHTIPPRARDAIGKAKFSRSLETDSYAEAVRRAVPLEIEWRRQIAMATSDNPDQLDREYGHWLRTIRDAHDDNERVLAEVLLVDELTERLHHSARRSGIDPADQEALQALPEYSETQEAYQYATGQKVRLDAYTDACIALADLNTKTAKQRRASIRLLAASFPFVDNVTGPEVQRVINDRLLGGTSPATIRKQLSDWRAYWKYLASLGIVEKHASPFNDIELPKKRRNTGKPRDAFTAAEAVALLQAAIAKDDPMLADLIRLGMWTGARRGELCALKTSDVAGRFLSIRDGKTAAAIRSVPIHPRLQSTIDRLAADSDDSYLLSGLTFNAAGDRGDAVGKRFTKLKAKHEFDKRHVFHSFRATVSTLLENAGVQMNLAADIIGHEKTGMTYGYYSAGNWQETMAAAMDRIDYPGLDDADMQ